MVLLLGGWRGDRVFVHVSTDGELDAVELVRRLRVECGGAGGGSKKSAVWTVKSEEVV